MVRRLVLGLLVTAVACSGGTGKHTATAPPAGIIVTSPAFADNGAIPKEYTCDGAGQSPPLAWVGRPPGTSTYALVVDDPDAPNGGFLHWVVPTIPASVTSVPAAGKPGPPVPGLVQGKNGAGGDAWQPICPPHGARAHHYVFTVYAVGRPLALAVGATAAQVQAALRSAALATGQLTGTYQRS